MTGRRIRDLLWLALPLIALAYLVTGMVQTARVPHDDDWVAAARLVRESWQEGDRVVFSPSWAHAGAPHFQGLDIDLGESWDAYEMSLPTRIWVVASPDAPDPQLPQGFETELRTSVGRMVVHRWRPPASPRPVYSFLKNLADAQVARVRSDGRQECTLFHQGQWHCGTTHPWMYVGPHERDIDGRVRKVIYAHAVDPGSTLELAWTELPRARRLTLHFGQTLRAVERDAGAPTRLQVWLGDRIVLDRTLAIDDPRWQRADFEMEDGALTTVRLDVSTSANSWRQFCFTADLWD